MTSTDKVRVVCRFGGDLICGKDIVEPNKVYYKGGDNYIVHVDRATNYANLLSKLREICKVTDISIKYKYPTLDLDIPVSIEKDEDVSNMMEAFPQTTQPIQPIQLFVFPAQNLSNAIPIHSNMMRSTDNGNVQLRDLHESNGTLAPSSHNTNVNDNDVPSASNDLGKVDCLLMDNQELPHRVVDSCVNDMPKMMSILKEGQEFEDKNAFHKALREYAIRSNFEYKRTRSGSGHYQAKCIEGDCSWRIHVCEVPNKPAFKIKSLNGNHTCYATNKSTMSYTRTHRQASRKWIAALVKDQLQKGLHCTPKDIIDAIRREYGIQVSYDKAWRGKELALKEMLCEQYVPDLTMLCKDIEMTNPGSTAKLNRSSDSSLQLFVAYKAAIHGFRQACRPLVKLDCMEMKGKCQGVWLFAMALDAVGDEFPVSYAFVESKNIGSWEWFCSELAQVLGCVPKLTFISDRQEGILKVVSGIFPDAFHRYAQGKLFEEIFCKFDCEDLDDLLGDAIYSGDRSIFKACMYEIRKKHKEAWNILKDLNPKHWATSHFEEKNFVCDGRYLDLDRVGDYWTDKMEGWREVPITWVLVNLHVHMIEIFNERFKESSNLKTIFVPEIEYVISKSEECKENYIVSGGGADFEVVYVKCEHADPRKVDLERRTCSCLDWQVFGYLCNDAIAAIEYSGCKIHDYVDVHYMVDKYKETYSDVIHPLLHLPKTSPSQPKKRKYVKSNMMSIGYNQDKDGDDSDAAEMMM